MSLKEKIAWYRLKRDYRKIKREVRLSDFTEGAKVGVLWHISDKDGFRYISDFLKKKQIIVRSLCYSGELNDAAPNTFGKKDTNFFGYPKKGIADGFMEHEYDLLMVISANSDFPMIVLTALTKAHFKIGPALWPVNYFDLSIDTGINKDSLYLVKQQIHYIEQFNQK